MIRSVRRDSQIQDVRWSRKGDKLACAHIDGVVSLVEGGLVLVKVR